MSNTAFQLQLEIAQRWQPIVEAAGMFDASYAPANTYMLAAVISADPIVHRRAFAKLEAAAQGDPDYASKPQNFTFEVLQEMTRVELDALRTRILTAYQRR